MIMQVIFAAIVYKFIVQQRNSVTAYLVGYGFVLPIVLAIPFILLEGLQIKNKITRLGLVTLPNIVFFRTLEAMYGTSPAVVEATLGNYLTYYTSLMSFEWNPKTLQRRKVTSAELGGALVNIAFHFTLCSLVLSLLMHFDFQPFPSEVDLAAFTLSLDLLSPSHLANSYLLVLLTYSVLATGFDLTAFSDQAKGFFTKPIFRNPMLQSRSISEFWGTRWNLMIHRFLKHGIYLPARKVGMPSWAAVALAFGFSGLLHDFSWAIIFYPDETCTADGTCFRPLLGKLTAFFLYCGACMLLERPLGPYLGFMKDWPNVVVAQLVLLTALPVAHWYAGDWAVVRSWSCAVAILCHCTFCESPTHSRHLLFHLWKGGYFSDFAIALWHIRKL
jgi:hypothetical protein